MGPLLLLAAFGAFATELCVAEIPSEPHRGAPIGTLDFQAPPLLFVPLDWEAKQEVRTGGKYYDERGLVYRFRDLEDFVILFVDGLHTEGAAPTAKDFYKGGFSKAPLISPLNPNYFDQVSSGHYAYTIVPTDRPAWRRAKKAARAANKGLREGRVRDRAVARAEDPDNRFRESLCKYNELRASQYEFTKVAQEALSDAKVLRHTARVDVPLAAFSFAKQVYAALELEPPTDDATQGADALALWNEVREMGGPDAVISALKAAARGGDAASLAELLASVGE